MIKAVTKQEPDDWTYDISGKNLADLNLMEPIMAMSEIAGYGVDKHRITDKNRGKKFPLFLFPMVDKKQTGLIIKLSTQKHAGAGAKEHTMTTRTSSKARKKRKKDSPKIKRWGKWSRGFWKNKDDSYIRIAFEGFSRLTGQ